MDAYPFVRLGLVAAVVILAIGVIAAELKIPYALQIIGAALAILPPVVAVISNRKSAGSPKQKQSTAPVLPDNATSPKQKRKKGKTSGRNTKVSVKMKKTRRRRAAK